MNISKTHLSVKKAVAIALPVAVCLSFSGCSFFNDLFSVNPQVSDKSEALLEENPTPKQTSYSYKAITNEDTKNLYAQIENECQKLTPDQIKCTGKLSEKDIYEAIVAFKNDHPDVFWLDNTFSYYHADGTTYVEISYIVTDSELSEQQETFNTAVENFINNATMYSSEYEREKYVNDYIVENCVYDDAAAENDNTLGNSSTAYGVLVDGKAVCEGYARAFQLLCNKMGIECVSVAGMTGNVGHEWNCANIDGNWYQIDVTWNDTGNDIDKYYYFNLTDEEMYYSHNVDDLFADIDEDNYHSDSNILGNLFVPKCSSTEYNYYQQTSPTLYGFNEENDSIITDALVNSARNGEKYFSIIIDTSLDYQDTYQTLVNDAYVVNYIEKANDILWGETKLDTTSYAYSHEPLRVMTIELNYID